MAENKQPRPVSLSPVQFADPGIHELTAGDVIRLYHNQEAKRKRDEGDYKERDVLITFRTAPDGLLGCLDNVADITGMRKSVVTKCLSLHLMSWYQNLPQVKAITETCKALRAKADGHPDIWRKMESDSYEFVCTRGVGGDKAYMRTVAYVLGYLGDISGPLGVPANKLFLAGLCWSIATNIENWSNVTVEKYLLPERDRMLDYINERVSLFRYVNEVLRVRSGEIKVEDISEDLKSMLGDELSPNHPKPDNG
jgi:hypothetical protein